jgi:hypothetical protein
MEPTMGFMPSPSYMKMIIKIKYYGKLDSNGNKKANYIDFLVNFNLNKNDQAIAINSDNICIVVFNQTTSAIISKIYHEDLHK